MKIYHCPKGHKYDGEYFKDCPHCMKENKVASRVTTNQETDRNIPKKRKPSVSHVVSSENLTQELDHVKEKVNQTKSVPKKQTVSAQKTLTSDHANSMVFMASMPSKITRNQETSVDFCLFESKTWREGADMLRFKEEKGVRDIKTLFLPATGDCTLSFSYKDSIIYEKDLSLEDLLHHILTIVITIPDNRDRRIHSLNIKFKLKDYDIEEVLRLQPTIS